MIEALVEHVESTMRPFVGASNSINVAIFYMAPLQGLPNFLKKHGSFIHRIEKQYFAFQSSTKKLGFRLFCGFCGGKNPYQDMNHKCRSLQKNINSV